MAQEAAAVAERLKALSAKQGIELGWSNVTGDASSMTIEGLTAKPAGESEAFPIGAVTLSGVTEENGGFRIATTSTAPISSTTEGVTVDLSEIVIKGLKIPAEDSDDPLAAISFYDSVEMASASVKMADKTVFSISGLSAVISPPVEGKPMDFTAGVASFSGDLSGVTDPQTKAIVDAFGYQTINGSYATAGTWNLADGRLNVTQNDVVVENAGKFGFKADISGYTLDFIKQMQEVQKKMAAQPAGEAASSAADMEMLGLLQQLSLNGAAIRFDDASLTGKVLDFVAQQQGQKREDVVNLAKASLPFLLMQMQLPDLAAVISPAVNTYLDDPKSIEIKAAPAAPVPFPLIAAAGMANPDPGAAAKAIWSLLGVTVTANQP